MRTYAFAKVGICRHAAYIYQNSHMLALNWYKSPIETTHDNGTIMELT